MNRGSFYRRLRPLITVVAALSCGACISLPNAPAKTAAGSADPAAVAPSELAAATAPPGASGSPASSPRPAPGGAGAPKPEASPLKSYAEVLAGAKESKGLFTVWQKDDKVWLEINEDQLDVPFFFSSNVADAVGERGSYAASMGDSTMATFHRLGNTIQLIAKNAAFVATAGSPSARAVQQSFSDSLISASPVLNRPEAGHKSVVIDASALLLSDIPEYSATLERAFHIAYAMDRGNSGVTKVRAEPTLTTFNVRAHFATARLPVNIAPGNPFPPIYPVNSPDPRSFFIGFIYNFAALPEPMKPRLADDRVGYFITTVSDFSNDNTASPRVHMIDRWRLEKADPSAALSLPKQPIVFWIDRNVPERYRSTISDGILEWNKAFERIGYKDAIEVKIQPDDAEFDTLDTRHASIRWFLGSDAGFARGPHQSDPRTGEILAATIQIPDGFTRSARLLRAEVLPPSPGPGGSSQADFCDLPEAAQEELGFSLGLLEARGDFTPDSPQAEALARAYLRDTVTHEVGHTLGLRHNFRASTIRTEGQLANADFTRTHGLSGSVMDYNPFNIAIDGESQGEYVMSGLGPYDYWAIEYGYKDFAEGSEAAGLKAIAARSTEPELAFGTDEDASAQPDGYDPEINRFDLGDDPLAYFKKRMQLSRELWSRLEKRQIPQGDSYLAQRRDFERGFSEVSRAAPFVAKFVGGVHTTRDHAGTGRPLLSPVEATRQKLALNLLVNELFSEKSFRFPPEFMSRLGIDYLDRNETPSSNTGAFYLAGRVLAIQTSVLDHVLSDPVAARIMDSETLSSKPSTLLTLPQLYDALQDSIWSELRSGGDISRMRRNLQREHLHRMLAVLLRPSAGTLADVKSLQRQRAIVLRERIRRALASAGHLGEEARAHLEESAASIDEVMKALPTKAT